MFLGEVVSNKHDLDFSSYNEAIFDKNLENWRSTMKVEDGVYMIERDGFIDKSQ